MKRFSITGLVTFALVMYFLGLQDMWTNAQDGISKRLKSGLQRQMQSKDVSNTRTKFDQYSNTNIESANQSSTRREIFNAKDASLESVSPTNSSIKFAKGSFEREHTTYSSLVRDISADFVHDRGNISHRSKRDIASELLEPSDPLAPFRDSNLNLIALKRFERNTCTEEEYKRTRCPDRLFYPFSGTCRYCSWGNNEPMTWQDARNFCKTLGADLFVLSNTYIMDGLEHGQIIADKEWVGAYFNGTALVWIDGSKFNNDTSGKSSPRNGDCVYGFINSEKEVSWNESVQTQVEFVLASCSQKFHFSCIKASALQAGNITSHNYSMTVNFKGVKDNYVAVGDKISVRCEGIRPAESNLSLCFCMKEITNDQCPKGDEVFRGWTFEIHRGICSRRDILIQSFIAKLFTTDIQLGCCYKRFYDTSSVMAVKSYPIHIRHEAMRPNVAMYKNAISSGEGQSVSGKCLGRLGHDNTASFALLCLRRYPVWLTSFVAGDPVKESKKTKHLVPGLSYEVSMDMSTKDTLGLWYVISFELSIPDGNFHGAVFACFSYDAKLEDLNNTESIKHNHLAAVSEHVQIIFETTRPKMTANLYGTSGIVFGGDIIEVECTAHVGSSGHLTWVVKALDSVFSCDFKFDKYGGCPLPGCKADFKVGHYERTENYMGPVEFASLSFMVTQWSDGLVLECYSVDFSLENSFRVQSDALSTRLRRINVKFIPQDPILNVSYGDFKGEKRIIANCAAFVGSDGDMSVVLIERDIVKMVFHLTYERLSGEEAIYPDYIWDSKTSFDDMYGPRASIKLAIPGSSGLEYGQIGCLAQKFSEAHIGEKFNTTSNLMKMQGILYKVTTPKGLNSFQDVLIGVVILITVLLLIIGFVTIIFTAGRKSDKEEEHNDDIDEFFVNSRDSTRSSDDDYSPFSVSPLTASEGSENEEEVNRRVFDGRSSKELSKNDSPNREARDSLKPITNYKETFTNESEADIQALPVTHSKGNVGGAYHKEPDGTVAKSDNQISPID